MTHTYAVLRVRRKPWLSVSLGTTQWHVTLAAGWGTGPRGPWQAYLGGAARGHKRVWGYVSRAVDGFGGFLSWTDGA